MTAALRRYPWISHTQRLAYAVADFVGVEVIPPVDFFNVYLLRESTEQMSDDVNNEKKRQVCSDVESTNRCLLKSIELPEAFWCRVSGTLGPGFLGAARCSLSRRAHVKAKGTLDSVEQKNYAVGEQKVGQPRRPTSCVLSFVEAEN